MKLTDLLDQIDRLELEIYPGPWVANDLGIGYEITTQQHMPINSGIKDTFPRSEAEFIALARDALPKLAKVIDELINHCHEVMSWETPRGHEERIALESRRQGARAVYKAITNALEADDA